VENYRRTLHRMLSLLLELGFNLPGSDGALQRRVVLFVLVRVGDREGRDRLSEGVALPMYPLSKAAEPERAWESASALPHQFA